MGGFTGFAGQVSDPKGHPITIDGLWGLAVGSGAAAGPTSTLFFARMIKKPGAPDPYGFLEQPGRMASFDGQLSENDVTTLVRFLRGDYLPVSSPSGAPPGTRTDTRFVRGESALPGSKNP